MTQVLDDGSSQFLYGLGRIGEEQSGGWQYHLGDALASVRQLTNAAGSVTLSQSYEPFGGALSSSGGGTSDYGFTGEWTDATELIHLRARYYDPASGRFLNRDPFPGDLRLPASAHPFTYAYNNPLRFTDPSGRFVGLLTGGLSAIAEYGYQVYQNISNCGMDFWNAAYHENLDLGRIGLAFAEGLILGSFGVWTGGLIGAAGWTGARALGAAAILNVSASAFWDIIVRGYAPSEAFVRNAVSFGIGEALGFAGRRVVSAVRTSSGAARFVVDANGQTTVFLNNGTLKVSEHAGLRMAQRHITVDVAEDIVIHQPPLPYYHEGVWKTGYYDPTRNVFVGTLGGEVRTFIRPSAGSQYIRNLQMVQP